MLNLSLLWSLLSWQAPQADIPARQLPIDVREKIVSVMACNHPAHALELALLSRGVRAQFLARLDHPEVLAQVAPAILVKYPGWKNYLHHLLEKHPKALSKSYLANHKRWQQAAITSAVQNSAPDYLVELLTVQGLTWESFLRDREQHLMDEDAWKEHVVATAVMFATIFEVANLTAKAAARRVAYVVDPRSMDVDAARVAMERVVGSLVDAESRVAALQAVSSAVQLAADTAAAQGARRALGLGLTGHALDQAAYRAAQLESWMVLLDPQHQMAEKVYAVVFAVTEGVVMPNSWFESKEVFVSQVDKYLVHGPFLKDTSRQLVQPLVAQLKRMSDKLFPEPS
ncbi:MAG: hypothetical protein OXT67_11700 [Zetaproteobacteria bacterium]|nr:hypothetical protein [Zetaproteobacteria bacterium]